MTSRIPLNMLAFASATQAEKQIARDSIGVRARFPRLVKSTNLVDVNIASIGGNLATSYSTSFGSTDTLVAGFEGTVPVGQSVVIQILCYDVLDALAATLSSAAIAGAGYGIYKAKFNPAGGAAPALHANTKFGQARIDYAAAAGFTISYIFLMHESEWPGVYGTARQNSGQGTHEGASDATHLYAISHSFNELVKYDTNLVRQGVVTVGDYPHDVVTLGNDVWVINYEAATLQRITKAPFALANTYVAGEGHLGFGLATDGTSRLWVAYGDTMLGQTANIRSVNPATGVQTFLTNDVNGLNANIPLRYLDGYLWSIKNVTHHTDGEVKKINPATGATVMTIPLPGLGMIYGLGSGAGKIFANAYLGVAQINAASGAIEKVYRHRRIRGGASNVEVIGDIAYAPAGNGLLAIDINAMRSEETFVVGGAKWARALPNGDVVMAPYGQPWMHVLSAA